VAGDARYQGKTKTTESAKKPKVTLDLDRSFGPALRRCRRRAGLTKETLSQRAEVHRTEISLIERGLRNAGVDVVTRLIGALEVDPADLFDGAIWTPPDGGRKGRFSYRKKVE
jgi:transcriptional regulator with XRE-family HTH domain